MYIRIGWDRKGYTIVVGMLSKNIRVVFGELIMREGVCRCRTPVQYCTPFIKKNPAKFP